MSRPLVNVRARRGLGVLVAGALLLPAGVAPVATAQPVPMPAPSAPAPAPAPPLPAASPALAAPAPAPPALAAPAPAAPVVASGPVSAAAAAAEAWRLGNEAYRRGQFAEAIDRYQRALAAGGESADGYYNLGTAYYRVGRHGQAILYLEKALTLAPRADDARANLAIVRRHLDLDKQLQELGISPEGFWRRLSRALTLDEVAVGFLALYFLFFGALAVRRLVSASTPRALLGIGAAALLAATTLAGSFLAYRLYRAERTREGVILEAKTPLMEPHGGSWKSVRALPEGLRVRVESQNDRWVQIRLPGGLSGYVKKGQVGVL